MTKKKNFLFDTSLKAFLSFHSILMFFKVNKNTKQNLRNVVKRHNYVKKWFNWRIEGEWKLRVQSKDSSDVVESRLNVFLLSDWCKKKVYHWILKDNVFDYFAFSSSWCLQNCNKDDKNNNKKNRNTKTCSSLAREEIRIKSIVFVIDLIKL